MPRVTSLPYTAFRVRPPPQARRESARFAVWVLLRRLGVDFIVMLPRGDAGRLGALAARGFTCFVCVGGGHVGLGKGFSCSDAAV